MQNRLAAAALFAAASFAAPAAAQIANLPPEVAAKIAAMGPVLTPDMIGATIGLLKPLAAAAPSAGIAATMDAAYGEDPLQKLDLYRPEGGRNLPVIVFVHGGGFIRGDKNSYGSIYANVPRYFARHGVLGVNLNYRLAPQAPWPAGAQDIGKAVAWLKANATAQGGDPNRIFLFGHSAGATHVASYVLDPSLQPKSGAGIAGAILVSGFYQVTAENLEPNIAAYFGEDASQFTTRSPISHARESKVPLFLAVAEYDPPFLEIPTLDLAAKVCARDGKCPPLAWLKGHNHISEVASLDTADEELGRKVVEFVAAH